MIYGLISIGIAGNFKFHLVNSTGGHSLTNFGVVFVEYNGEVSPN